MKKHATVCFILFSLMFTLLLPATVVYAQPPLDDVDMYVYFDDSVVIDFSGTNNTDDPNRVNAEAYFAFIDHESSTELNGSYETTVEETNCSFIDEGTYVDGELNGVFNLTCTGCSLLDLVYDYGVNSSLIDLDLNATMGYNLPGCNVNIHFFGGIELASYENLADLTSSLGKTWLNETYLNSQIFDRSQQKLNCSFCDWTIIDNDDNATISMELQFNGSIADGLVNLFVETSEIAYIDEPLIIFLIERIPDLGDIVLNATYTKMLGGEENRLETRASVFFDSDFETTVNEEINDWTDDFLGVGEVCDFVTNSTFSFLGATFSYISGEGEEQWLLSSFTIKQAHKREEDARYSLPGLFGLLDMATGEEIHSIRIVGEVNATHRLEITAPTGTVAPSSQSSERDESWAVWNDVAFEDLDDLLFETVPINEPPVANAGEDKAGWVGKEISFSAAGSYDTDGNIVAYLWDFGDGYNATEMDVTHTYTTEGNYTVVLIVTDNSGDIGADTCRVIVVSWFAAHWFFIMLLIIIIVAIMAVAVIFYWKWRKKKKPPEKPPEPKEKKKEAKSGEEQS